MQRISLIIGYGLATCIPSSQRLRRCAGFHCTASESARRAKPRSSGWRTGWKSQQPPRIYLEPREKSGSTIGYRINRGGGAELPVAVIDAAISCAILS
jgi:hypothetical protein